MNSGMPSAGRRSTALPPDSGTRWTPTRPDCLPAPIRPETSLWVSNSLRIRWLFNSHTSARWLSAVILYVSSFASSETVSESLPCSRLLGSLISLRRCSWSLSELLVIEVNQTQSEKSLKCKCVKESESFKRPFVLPQHQHQCSLTNTPQSPPFPGRLRRYPGRWPKTILPQMMSWSSTPGSRWGTQSFGARLHGWGEMWETYCT